MLGISALLALFFKWDEPVYYTAVRQTCLATMVFAVTEVRPARTVYAFMPTSLLAVGGALLMMLDTFLIGNNGLLRSSALPTLLITIA